MRKSRIGLAVALLLAASSPGCTSWHSTNKPPASAVQDRTERVRVTRVSGGAATVYRPAVVGDSLVGASSEKGDAALVAIPLADIRDIQTRHVSTGRTVGLIAGITVALLALVQLAAASVPPTAY